MICTKLSLVTSVLLCIINEIYSYTAGCDTDTMFACGNGQCIKENFKCNGIPDCLNRADERNCEELPKNCDVDELDCGSGVCLPNRYKCDGRLDCDSEVDETNCEQPLLCRIDEFDCGNQQCLPKHNVCDGFDDCINEADEKNCEQPPLCRIDEFDCGNQQCLPKHNVCDGFDDCVNEADEQNCEQPPLCRIDEFDCGNQQCLPKHKVCDGFDDCINEADEQNCEQPPWCAIDEFYCGDNRCLPKRNVCDGIIDCENGADEQICGPFKVYDLQALWTDDDNSLNVSWKHVHRTISMLKPFRIVTTVEYDYDKSVVNDFLYEINGSRTYYKIEYYQVIKLTLLPNQKPRVIKVAVNAKNTADISKNTGLIAILVPPIPKEYTAEINVTGLIVNISKPEMNVFFEKMWIFKAVASQDESKGKAELEILKDLLAISTNEVEVKGIAKINELIYTYSKRYQKQSIVLDGSKNGLFKNNITYKITLVNVNEFNGYRKIREKTYRVTTKGFPTSDRSRSRRTPGWVLICIFVLEILLLLPSLVCWLFQRVIANAKLYNLWLQMKGGRKNKYLVMQCLRLRFIAGYMAYIDLRANTKI